MDNILSFFAILSALSTAIYTFITIKTLLEIKKQRETTYMPQVILGESFYTMINDTENLKEIVFENTKTKIRQKKCSLHIYNIGLASAKNLKFQFKVDTNHYLNLIKENLKDFSTNEKVDGFLFIESNSRQCGHNVPLQLYKEKDFLLPVNIQKSPFKVDIPLYLTELLSIIIFDIDNNYDLIEKLPNFELEIKYDDLYNKTHIEIYSLRFNIFSMSKTDVIFEILKND